MNPDPLSRDRFDRLRLLFKVALAQPPEERQAFLDLHELYGLPESALDAEITLSGLRLRIAGIRTKAPKNNILLASLDGRGNRVAPLSLVKAALKRSQG